MPQVTHHPRRFIITVDDPGGLIQDLEIFHRVLHFFAAEQVPASFFVVPRGKEGWQLDQEREWVTALKTAETEGHDSQLHGLEHGYCEFGPYAWFVRAMGRSDDEEWLRAARKQCGRLWQRELFAEKLGVAITIFEKALGHRPQVFRSGALSQSTELYEALVDVGIRYTSNHVVDPRGWMYICGNYDNPANWDPRIPPIPHWLTRDIISLPMISEFAWQLTPEKVRKHLALAVEDLRRVYEVNGVYVLICHVQEVGADHPYSRELLSRLFAVARQEFEAEFLTLRDLVTQIESGDLPAVHLAKGETDACVSQLWK